MCREPKIRPSPRALFGNFRGPEPRSVKLRLLFKNMWLKLKNRRNCCGHPGEPGC
jgi:hypothetical protein